MQEMSQTGDDSILAHGRTTCLGAIILEARLKALRHVDNYWDKYYLNYPYIWSVILILMIYLWDNAHLRDVILVFSRGRQNFDRLPRGGQNMKKNIFFCVKTQKITIFQNPGCTCPPSPKWRPWRTNRLGTRINNYIIVIMCKIIFVFDKQNIGRHTNNAKYC